MVVAGLRAVVGSASVRLLLRRQRCSVLARDMSASTPPWPASASVSPEPWPEAVQGEFPQPGVDPLNPTVHPEDKRLGIKAFYVGRAININKAHQELCMSRPHRFRRDFLMVSFPDSEGSTTTAFGNKHMVVFNYGSVVFFNFSDAEIQGHLMDVKLFTSEPIPREFQMTEDYTLVERPYLQQSCVLHTDLTILRAVDLHSATVVSTVMAQTVALDHYSNVVDQMLEVFQKFNHSVEKTGQFTAIEKTSLFRLVAQNNAILIDVLAKLALLERSDIAWRMPEYVSVWEGLRDEFEVESRFNNLKYKLGLIQENTKFFLEIMHNQKSNSLEWVIIVLISAEIIVCTLDLCDIKPTWVVEKIAAFAA